jgi:hypothetical protein
MKEQEFLTSTKRSIGLILEGNGSKIGGGYTKQVVWVLHFAEWGSFNWLTIRRNQIRNGIFYQ